MGDVDRQKILMARIGAAHGIRGEVRVKPFGNDPLSFADYGALVTSDGDIFEVERARVQKTVVVTKFEGIDDRNQAEALNGVDLYIFRDQLPPPNEDEFYHTDLAGLLVFNTSGDDIGKIATVQDFGAGDLLEIRPKRGRTFYVPFTKAFVPQVDFDAGKVIVDLPDDYLSEGSPERGADRSN